MNNYCTLFDSYYLSRGLIMIDSLQKDARDFHLYVFAFDDLSYSILTDLNIDNTTVISLEEFETPALLQVKKERSKAEYCWTSTPWIIRHVFDKYNVQNCTYIDADLKFYDDPALLLSELNPDSTSLITEHRYALLEKIYEEKRAGRFCVQFVYFNTYDESRSILNTWADQCIEWCYNRYEDGKFGDQKYLDEWPEKYNGVHILNNEGGGVAPWNIKKYKFSALNDSIEITNRKTKNKFRLVFYHFQSLKLINGRTADLGWHYINGRIRELIYKDYITELIETENKLTSKYSDYNTTYHNPAINNLKDRVKTLSKNLSGYNIFKL